MQNKMPNAQVKLFIDKLRDHRRKKQHHRINMGGTSAQDHDHIGQFGERKKTAMLKNRQLQGEHNNDEVFADNLSEFENSAMVELGNDEETRVVSEFMIANEKQEQKMLINKETTETKIQKRKLCNELNIRTDDNYKLSESNSSVDDLKEIPDVDEELLPEVLVQVHHELSEEEEAQSVQHMQQALAAEDTSVDAEEVVPHDTAQDSHSNPVPDHTHSQPVPEDEA